MKKIFLLPIIAMSALLASCAGEPLADGQANDMSEVAPMRFSAGFEMTKAELSGHDVIWQEGDALGVFDGAAFRKFTLVSGAGTTSAEFEGEAVRAGSYYLVYPYSEDLAFSNGRIIAGMPSVQTASEAGDSPREALICVARTNDPSRVTLKNAFSLVKIDVPAGISSITFQGNCVTAEDGTRTLDALAGRISIDPQTGESIAVEPESTVVVDVPAEGGEVIFATIPAPLASGFKLSLRKDGEECDAVLTVDEGRYALVRNAGISIQNLPEPVFNKFFVRDVADFKKIAVSSTLQGCKVYLGDDLDFGGETIAAIPAFSGTFEGQGHKLYNFKVSGDGQYSGVFAVTTGIVKDIIAGSEDGKAWDGVSEISINWTKDVVSDFAGLGFIGKACNSISGIVNHAKLTSTTTTQLHAGGIVGVFYSDGTGYYIDDCHAYNQIDYNHSSTTTATTVGGIAGRLDGINTDKSIAVPAADDGYSVRITGCTSSTAIDTHKAHCRGASGMVGSISQVSVLLSDVTFDGSISSISTNSNYRMGGMFGYVNGKSVFKVRHATFAGNVDIAASYAAGCVSGGNTNTECHIEDFYTTADCSFKTGAADNAHCGMIIADPLLGGIHLNGGAIAGTITNANSTVTLDPSNYKTYIQSGSKVTSEAELATIRFNGDSPTPPPTPTTLKLLAVGNSFSEDSMEHGLPGLLKEAGIDFIIGDAYISGCPLDKHYDQAYSGNATYSYRKFVNSVDKTTKTSQTFKSIIQDEEWDIISFQQGAGYHGFYTRTKLPDIAIQDWSLTGDKQYSQAMDPSLTNLINYCRANAAKKDFKVAFNSCWASTKLTSGAVKCQKFSYYEYDQEKMYNAIVAATRACDEVHDFDYIFDCNSAVQNGRTSYIGDRFGRGDDGWHLQDGYGRMTANCVWFEVLTGLDCRNYEYVYKCTPEQGMVAKEAAHAAVANPYTVTDLSWIPNPGQKPAVADTLAYWYFTPSRAKSDGCSRTWTGQDNPAVVKWSKEAGLMGTYKANGTLANGKETHGMISYYQVDKTGYSGKGGGYSIYDASTGGQPVFGGGWPGDFLLFESNGGVEISDGTKVHFKCTITPMAQGPKYYRVEYLNADDEWVAPSSMPLTTGTVESGESTSYNVSLSSKTKRTIDFTETLAVGRTDFKVRITCASRVGVDGVSYSAPNDNVDGSGKYQTLHPRITGTPGNGELPLIEIRLD